MLGIASALAGRQTFTSSVGRKFVFMNNQEKGGVLVEYWIEALSVS